MTCQSFRNFWPESDRCWSNHHCNDAILSHTLTLVAYARRSEFTKFEAFWWSKCPRYLNFLWNYSRAHYIDVRWWTSKWTLGYKRKKGWGGGREGVTPRLTFHYLILFLSLAKKNYICLDNIRRIFLVNWTEWGIHRYKLP